MMTTRRLGAAGWDHDRRIVLATGAIQSPLVRIHCTRALDRLLVIARAVLRVRIILCLRFGLHAGDCTYCCS